MNETNNFPWLFCLLKFFFLFYHFLIRLKMFPLHQLDPLQGIFNIACSFAGRDDFLTWGLDLDLVV